MQRAGPWGPTNPHLNPGFLTRGHAPIPGDVPG